MPGLEVVNAGAKRAFNPMTSSWSRENYKGSRIPSKEPSMPRGSFFSDLGDIAKPVRVKPTQSSVMNTILRLRVPTHRSPISDRTRARRERINAGESLKTILFSDK